MSWEDKWRGSLWWLEGQRSRTNVEDTVFILSNDKFEHTEEDKKFPIEKFCFLKNYEKNKDSKLKVEKQSWGEESTE